MRIALFSTTATLALLGATALPGVAQTYNNSTPIAQSYYAPQINSFTVNPADRLYPGTELVFTLEGTPNSRATLTIPNVARNLPMQEVAPGVYQGRYTIRNQDQFSPQAVRANLSRGDRAASARLQQPFASGYPNDNFGNRPTYDDRPYSNNPYSNNPDSNNPYNNQATQLPLQIITPQNNSRVQGAVELRGISAPNTTVEVNVKAVNSLGGLIGLNRDVASDRVQTDSQGNFIYNFNPSISVPGTRYEVSLNAINGSQTSQRNLTLIQQ